ncbi:putative LysR family transcriptional regulator [Streptomyces sp. NBRC 110611]|uniref:LysR family transcriptional regulator n=1 Tax=Streptomyces sp. NBRC 110611 TaxID=1621259 RepID=UPI0008302139|nr:LysR family transcriptional regulator [Streptomyces sp. NBRC 110611]GAU65729.1 putative LysR family transcriptional regulator [Streptomyces sp. NBRC 110611]
MTHHADFTLTQLRYFVTSAEMGNISDAAQFLHASQSAVSMAIQRLEKQLGTQLFVRHRTKGVSLTPCGRAFFVDARSLLLHAQEVQVRCRERQGEVWGKLSVAFLHSIASPVVPALLSKLRRLHPQLTVTVHEGTVDESLDLLRSGTCELAVTGEIEDQSVTFTRLARVPLEALVSQTDMLAPSGRATLKELATRPLLVVDTPADHAVVTAVRTRFAAAGAPVPQVVETSSVGTMLGLIRAGEGFALMPRGVADTILLGDCIVPVSILSERPCASDIGVTRLQGLPASKRVEEFVLALCDTVREIYGAADDEPEPARRAA